jgi:hypothetical protein
MIMGICLMDKSRLTHVMLLQRIKFVKLPKLIGWPIGWSRANLNLPVEKTITGIVLILIFVGRPKHPPPLPLGPPPLLGLPLLLLSVVVVLVVVVMPRMIRLVFQWVALIFLGQPAPRLPPRLLLPPLLGPSLPPRLLPLLQLPLKHPLQPPLQQLPQL